LDLPKGENRVNTRKELTNQKKKRYLPLEIKILVLILMVLAAMTFVGLNSFSQALIPITGTAGSNAMDALAARYQGLADFQAYQAANYKRLNAVWADRLQGQAEAFAFQNVSLLHANAAYAERLQGLANFYALKETERFQRANDAYSARLQGHADWFAREN
jgi:hypothetical protein